MAYTISFNDVDLSTYGLYLSPSKIPYYPRTRISTAQPAFKDGSYFQNTNANGRDIDLTCSITAATNQALKNNLHTIMEILNVDTPKKLVLTDYKVTETAYDSSTSVVTPFWLALVDQNIDVSFLNKYVATLQISFFAPDPSAYGGEQTQAVGSIVVGANDVSVIAGGTTGAYPHITLTRTGATGGAAVSIRNANTAETISWNGTLEQNKSLIFYNSELWKVTNDSANDMSGVSGIFWALEGKATNTVTITTDFTGTASFNWYNRYR